MVSLSCTTTSKSLVNHESLPCMIITPRPNPPIIMVAQDPVCCLPLWHVIKPICHLGRAWSVSEHWICYCSFFFTYCLLDVVPSEVVHLQLDDEVEVEGKVGTAVEAHHVLSCQILAWGRIMRVKNKDDVKCQLGKYMKCTPKSLIIFRKWGWKISKLTQGLHHNKAISIRLPSYKYGEILIEERSDFEWDHRRY